MPSSPLPFRPRVVAAAALIAVGLAAIGRDAIADEDLERRTTAGREVLLRGFAEFDADCRLRHVQSIAVVDPPAHGRIDQRPGTVTIGENWVGNKTCAGTRLDGVRVYYLPDDGFVGSDRLSFDVEYANHRTVRAHVAVTVEAVPGTR